MSKKILIISSLQESTPPFGYGGIERFVHFLANALIEQGFDITVMCKNGSTGGNYKKWEVSLTELDAETIKNKILQDEYSLVHINTKIPSLIDSLRNIGIPIVLTLHNNFRPTSSWANIMKDDTANFYYTVISKSLRERVLQGLGKKGVCVPRNGVINLGFGMDVKAYTQKRDLSTKKEYYLYLGVIARYKGVLDIANTFSGLNESLIIVGPNNIEANKAYSDSVKQVAHSNNHIEYLGETESEDQKIKILNGAKAVIIATGYDSLEKDCHEAFGLVMLEANSLGIPVIGYSKGNVADYIIDGVNGYKFNDLAELPVLIEKLNGKDLSKTCIDYAERFDISECSKKYSQFFEKIIEDNS